jgi:phage-related protein
MTWRIVYRIDPDAILVVHWFEKKTKTTPKRAIDLCKKRLGDYDRGYEEAPEGLDRGIGPGPPRPERR